MKKAAFARLCGVSPPMIAKYEKLGLIVIGDDGVDAAASLKLLQGRLCEEKRTAAIVALADGRDSSNTPAARISTPKPEPAPAHARPSTSAPDDPVVIELAARQLEQAEARAQREKLAVRRAEIELGELAGRLVDAKEVQRAIEDAVAVFWNEIAQREKPDADLIASALKLNEFQARQLRAELRRRRTAFQSEFASAMRAAANHIA